MRQPESRRDGVHHIEGTLERTEKLDALRGTPGRHALRLKIHLFLQPRLPFTLDHRVGLFKAFSQVAALGVITVYTIVLAPDQLFTGLRLIYRKDRRQRLYPDLDGVHRPFEALAVWRGDKRHRLRRVIDLRRGKRRIVLAHYRDIILAGNILRRDQHRPRPLKGGKCFYSLQHAARHLRADNAAYPAAGNIYVLKKLDLSRDLDGTVKARQRFSNDPELFAHRRTSQLEFPC
ncbi:hypothetical protein SDC9_92026 [bioreactor metagenome]|uniref:Uncharacterized protein n=1 Tax=bioreactor metagenome TaxID=1076179 RepID=A0A644ZWJ0_9ZZZZ